MIIFKYSTRTAIMRMTTEKRNIFINNNSNKKSYLIKPTMMKNMKKLRNLASRVL